MTVKVTQRTSLAGWFGREASCAGWSNAEVLPCSYLPHCSAIRTNMENLSSFLLEYPQKKGIGIGNVPSEYEIYRNEQKFTTLSAFVLLVCTSKRWL